MRAAWTSRLGEGYLRPWLPIEALVVSAGETEAEGRDCARNAREPTAVSVRTALPKTNLALVALCHFDPGRVVSCTRILVSNSQRHRYKYGA